MEQVETNKQQLYTKIQDRVGYLVLNKAPANGYELNFLTQLKAEISLLDANPEVKVVVISSALARFFCAGADIKVFGANTTEENRAMVVVARSVAAAISDSPKLYIAALNGHTLGGGLELAMACDLRLAAEGSYLLGLPEIKLGLIPGNGGTIRLLQLIGAGRAMELLASGNSIQPDKALQYGLLNQLFPAETFEADVHQYAAELASGAGRAMTQVKRFLREASGLSLQQGLELETELVNTLYGTPDAIEGFQAFIEKRPPEFE